jgi:creatinine amidohydrolase
LTEVVAGGILAAGVGFRALETTRRRQIMRTVQFELLRPHEILAERARRPLVYVPVGPLEWHSVHLPFGTDALIAGEVARRAAGRTGGVVLPTFFWGTERERSAEMVEAFGFDGGEYVVGMDFPANVLKSLYCREEFLALLLRELLDRLIRLEYRLIVIVNGHGATNQLGTLERLSREFSAASSARVMLANAWSAEELPQSAHAGASETAVMMALFPEAVDLAQLPDLPQPLRSRDWAIVDGETFAGRPTPDFTLRPAADPRLEATLELGQHILAGAVDGVVEAVQTALAALGL